MGVVSLVLHHWFKPSWSRYHAVSLSSTLSTSTLSVYLSVSLSICLSIYLFGFLSVYLYVCYSVCLYICLAICMSARESVYLFGCLWIIKTILHLQSFSLSLSLSLSVTLTVTVPLPLTASTLSMVQWCPLWSSCGITCNTKLWFTLLRTVCHFQHISQCSLGQLMSWVTWQHYSRKIWLLPI